MRHILGGSIPNVRVSELRSDNSAVYGTHSHFQQ